MIQYVPLRLTSQVQIAIVQTFQQFFAEGDHIWLFGSRVDDAKRGGDIDLYIETQESDTGTLRNQKIKFLVNLEKKIGEQKIDVVIKTPQKTLPIHTEAKATGVFLI